MMYTIQMKEKSTTIVTVIEQVQFNEFCSSSNYLTLKMKGTVS